MDGEEGDSRWEGLVIAVAELLEFQLETSVSVDV